MCITAQYYSCHVAYISSVMVFSILAYEWSRSGGWNRKSNHKQNQNNGYNHCNKYSKMPISDILQHNYKKCIFMYQNIQKILSNLLFHSSYIPFSLEKGYEICSKFSTF